MGEDRGTGRDDVHRQRAPGQEHRPLRRAGSGAPVLICAGDVDSEAAALVRVAHYYGHSPLVSGIPGHRRTPGKFSLLHEHHEERVSV